MNSYATVKIGDFKIPLIGIDAKETSQQCDNCKNNFYLLEIEFDINGNPLCFDCLLEKKKYEK